MSGGWRVLNPSRIVDRLKNEPDDVKAAVADAIEVLLENPYDPSRLEVHAVRGSSNYEMRIAFLPDDWYLTYVPYPYGLPPLAGKLIVVRALVKRIVTPEEFEVMVAEQQGLCAICKKPPVGKRRQHDDFDGDPELRPLDIDHDPKTGVVRGLLCNPCNQAIGFLQDDPDLMRRAADYVEEASATRSSCV